ncbi:hypothetical protein T439DRAFT_329835, partial [Meredithblackwellia eburnea MCA 4105]
MSSRVARGKVRTLDPETAHERHDRLHKVSEMFRHGKTPARPASKTELDILKERRRFIHDTDVDPATLSWEDQIAMKYYSTLFREFCVVNLKHYKHGAIALRWRTEDEVLQGIAHLTCASMRCEFHLPPPGLDEEPDPESTEPLVPTRLTEYETNFSYVEEGEKKSALVKVVLCKDCGKKLLYGREKKKRNERRERGEDDRDSERELDVEGSKRSRNDRRGSHEERRGVGHGEEDEDFAPALPPDLREERHRHRRESGSGTGHSRRRSASPRQL